MSSGSPVFGLINTNLLGFDDKLTAIYQVPLESGWDDEYAIYGSYDFPIWGPKLRLNLYAGYNEFNISGHWRTRRVFLDAVNSMAADFVTICSRKTIGFLMYLAA